MTCSCTLGGALVLGQVHEQRPYRQWYGSESILMRKMKMVLSHSNWSNMRPRMPVDTIIWDKMASGRQSIHHLTCGIYCSSGRKSQESIPSFCGLKIVLQMNKTA